MSFTVVIPARYASTRFPGKPLAQLAGKPMIEHVYLRARESEASRVVVATDDTRIAEVVDGFGAEVVMTSTDHPSGTDRLQEVANKLGFYADEIVVNVQGDEPLIPSKIINQVAHNLAARPEAAIATLAEPIESVEALLNPNIVKVVTDRDGMALYFSRAPIAWPRDAMIKAGGQLRDLPDSFNWRRHIGMYAYRVRFLNDYVSWQPAPIETCESLEQLRALWNGARIHVDNALIAPPTGVDTPEDLDRLRALMG